MKKFLNMIITVALVTIVALSMVACTNTTTNSSDKKGLLIKKIDGVYTVYDYVDDGSNLDTLDMGEIFAQKEIADEDVRIKKGAFDGNSTLKKIIVPANVVTIDAGAFRNMQKLETLEVPFIGLSSNADAYYRETGSAEGKATDAARTIAHFFGTESYDAGQAITINYGASTVTCFMPVTFANVIVNASGELDCRETYGIPMYAFNGATNLKSIELKGDKLGAIGVNAFGGCVALTKVEIPATVKTIYEDAFKGCAKLETVTIKGSNVDIRDGAFEDTKYQENLDK